MREIKFRAWDKEEKIMSEGHPFSWFITGDNTDMEFPKNDESLPLTDLRKYLDDFVFMEGIGLKDKNEKEIYCGDYIKDTEGRIWEVYWDETFAGFRYLCEVIGNIYEDQQLLTINNK
jgi:uncharacterized phage protein (TIGR01671 family)